MTTTMIGAWHFLRDDRRLQFAHAGMVDLAVEIGQTLTVPVSADQPLRLCEYGLHASVRPLDALGYAPGAIVCRVRLSGKILAPKGDDKLCASERTVLAMADATELLHEFACWCAERVLQREREAAHEPDPRSWAAIAAKRAWLRGEITAEQLAAARSAAEAAAEATAEAAAEAAARSAAWAAAGYAAWAAAGYAAEAAAEAAAWAEINAELERRLLAVFAVAP